MSNNKLMDLIEEYGEAAQEYGYNQGIYEQSKAPEFMELAGESKARAGRVMLEIDRALKGENLPAWSEW